MLNATNTGYAKNLVMPHKHFTLKQKIQWQKKIIKHDRWIIATRQVHTIAVTRFARHQLRWTQLELRRSLQQLSYSALDFGSPSGWPLHHKLWDCIGKYEGSPTSVNPNGHYGLLQMHWNWGYGIVGAASNYSKKDQELAAERGYAASNYNTSFLYDQWFNYDKAEGECLQYA